MTGALGAGVGSQDRGEVDHELGSHLGWDSPDHMISACAEVSFNCCCSNKCKNIEVSAQLHELEDGHIVENSTVAMGRNFIC